MPGLLLDTLHGKSGSRKPIWLMRQAGRYLPEYRALRAEKGGFLELVHDSETAAEITLQPIRRFGFDGAILFSDILVIPHALGQDLAFLEGEGPHLSPPLVDRALNALEPAHNRLEPIYRTVKLVREQLGPETTLLGFAGSPWTVATYMIAGQGSRDQQAARVMAYRDPTALQAILDAIITLTVDYLSGQVEAGAEAVQLFDSWAGRLPHKEFERWVIAPNATIVERFKARHPEVPVIGFPKGAGTMLPAYAEFTNVDAVGLDETVDPLWAHMNLPLEMPVQGNLDPLLLLAGSEGLETRARFILEVFSSRPHVFNLGHGIDKETPIAHVERLLDVVRGWQG